MKNSKILVKFFRNKKIIRSSREKYIEGVNISIYGNNTALSLPSFNNAMNSSNSANGSSVENKQVLGKTLTSNNKLTISANTNTIKSTNTLELGYDFNGINNTTLNLCINSQPNFYSDYFTQNEIEWNFVKKEMQSLEASLRDDHTPSFHSFNTPTSDSIHNSFTLKIQSEEDSTKITYNTVYSHTNKKVQKLSKFGMRLDTIKEENKITVIPS